MKNSIQISDRDNVAVALNDLCIGSTIDSVSIRESIACGHKFSLSSIRKGQQILKCGSIIGIAKDDIQPGSHVHTHNVIEHKPDVFNVESSGADPSIQFASKKSLTEKYTSTFLGYPRIGRRAATRNYVAIVSTVNCSSTVTYQIAKQLNESSEFQHNDDFHGFFPVCHQSGCGLAQASDGLIYLQRTLSGLINNPNIIAALVVGLGCEDNQFDFFKNYINSDIPVDYIYSRLRRYG